MNLTRKLAPKLLLGAVLTGALPASVGAVTFSIAYDGVEDNSIGALVGTGSFSYDGPAAIGTFALDDLTGVSFLADFGPGGGGVFATADLVTDPATSGIAVYDAGGGAFGLVFTGHGGMASGGSLDATNVDGMLSHEPTAGIADPVGCCNGTGTTNLYFAFGPGFDLWGDYLARTDLTFQLQNDNAVPEPASLALAAMALLAAGGRRARQRAIS